MPRRPLPTVAVALSFIDCINRGDLDGLVALMHHDHVLTVLDEPPLIGRDMNRDAWRGYFAAFPEYVIYPRHIAAEGSTVAVLGTTTGSHLGLSDQEEAQLTIIWIATVAERVVTEWRIVDDSATARTRAGIPSSA